MAVNVSRSPFKRASQRLRSNSREAALRTRVVRRLAPELNANTCDQFSNEKRLYDVVVGPEFQADDPVGF